MIASFLMPIRDTPNKLSGWLVDFAVSGIGLDSPPYPAGIFFSFIGNTRQFSSLSEEPASIVIYA